MLLKSYRAVLKFFEKYFWIFFAAACLTLAFYCFRCLDVQYVDSWDEARHGVNAYEMMQNGNYIRHTYNYQVDDWNLKPSVSYWSIILGFKLFGYSVFGLRFASALAYLLTGIAAALFAKRYSKEASLLVMGFFCANTRPLSAHLARAGDADSLYLLFFTLAMLAMFRIKEKRKNLYLCGLMFALAFLTKSWHAGMIAAVGGLYLLLTGELFRLKGREWVIFLTSVFAPLLLWFGWRYTEDGFTFLKQMVEVDLLARTGTGNFEGHAYPFSFYWDMVFAQEGYIYRWLVLICIVGAAIGLAAVIRRYRRAGLGTEGVQNGRKDFLRRNRRVWEESAGYLLWFFVPFLGFSLVRAKLIWYCYPCIIPLFLVAAIFLGKVLRLPLTVCGGGCAEESRSMKTGAGAVRPETGLQRFAAGAGLWLAAIGCAVFVVYFMRGSYLEVIRGAQGDGFQMFIQESVERDSAYAGEKAYIMVPTEKPENLGKWDQNMLFLAEISGDFHCQNGGVESFLKEKEEAVLYLDTAHYAEYREALDDCEILYRNEGYVLVGKY